MERQLNRRKHFKQQESIPVGCVPTTCADCTCFNSHHQMLLMGRGPQMNKFEQVSSDHHQISVAGELPGLMSKGGGVPYLTLLRGVVGVRYPTMWATPPAANLWTDRRLWKHYLPAKIFAGGKKHKYFYTITDSSEQTDDFFFVSGSCMT